jgi:GNAT superfamily N-acetyltransferase
MASLTIRPARPADKAAVAELCALIWEGEDYIPEVFGDWVADPRGEFTVVYAGSQLVALGKLTEGAPDEWWLEGLRVHPDHRGRGLARQLHEYAVDLADRTARGVLRFTTSGSNAPVHALAERSGFRLVSRHYVARADAVPSRKPHGFRLASPSELSSLRTWLESSPYLAAAGGLMEDGWAWYSLLPQLESLVQTERVLWWNDGAHRKAGLAIVSQGKVEGETRFWVNFADAAPDKGPRLWRSLRYLAAERGEEILRAKPLATPNLATALKEASWELEPDHTMWVYARSLPAATTG